MPVAEVDVTVDLVESLIADQRPDLVDLTIEHLANGWDNISFRIGDRLVARFPRRQMAAELVESEARWLPMLAPDLPLPVPAPVFVGTPDHGYPWTWTLVAWIPGESAAFAQIDEARCARALGAFLRALHRPAPEDAPANPFRGGPLASRDEATRERIGRLEGGLDVSRVTALWEDALAVPAYDGPPLWIHGDLHPHNLLVVEKAICGVIDFGDLTAGDPSTDLAVAWMMFGPSSWGSLFVEYGARDDTVVDRARGWAVALSLAYLANSADNPTMHRIGATTLAAVLEDGG